MANRRSAPSRGWNREPCRILDMICVCLEHPIPWGCGQAFLMSDALIKVGPSDQMTSCKQAVFLWQSYLPFGCKGSLNQPCAHSMLGHVGTSLCARICRLQGTWTSKCSLQWTSRAWRSWEASPRAVNGCFLLVFEEMPRDCSSGTLRLGNRTYKASLCSKLCMRNQAENWLWTWF